MGAESLQDPCSPPGASQARPADTQGVGAGPRGCSETWTAWNWPLFPTERFWAWHLWGPQQEQSWVMRPPTWLSFSKADPAPPGRDRAGECGEAKATTGQATSSFCRCPGRSGWSAALWVTAAPHCPSRAPPGSLGAGRQVSGTGLHQSLHAPLLRPCPLVMSGARIQAPHPHHSGTVSWVDPGPHRDCHQVTHASCASFPPL